MNCKIPFTKDIAFDKKISEITSISLEHEIMPEEGLLKGNFIVSGDYKSHEVSINREPFSYILPFEIELNNDIDISTIEFMIDDFTYEIKNNKSLRVNIDFNVIASIKEKEEVVRNVDEIFVAPPEYNEEVKLEDLVENEEIKESEKDFMEDNELAIPVLETNERDEKEAQTIDDDIVDTKKIEDTIISNVGVDDEYATYHIHMVSDGETVETICTMYNSNINILADYNDLTNIGEGDKLIIPEVNE